MADDQEKKEEDKYEEVDPWKLVTEVPQAILATVAVAVMAPLGWLLTIFDEDHEPELKRDPKLKILRAIITQIFWDDLDDRELKVACHIVNSPWIPKNREKTIEELKSGKTLKGKKPKITFDRNRYTRLVNAVTKSEAFEKFSTKQFSEIQRFDVCRALQCTLETPPEKILANLAVLKTMATDLSSIKEYEKLTNDVLEFFNYIEENWEALQNE